MAFFIRKGHVFDAVKEQARKFDSYIREGSLVWYDEEWKRIFGGRGDEAGSGRVLVLRRGGWDVLVG